MIAMGVDARLGEPYLDSAVAGGTSEMLSVVHCGSFAAAVWKLRLPMTKDLRGTVTHHLPLMMAAVAARDGRSRRGPCEMRPSC